MLRNGLDIIIGQGQHTVIPANTFLIAFFHVATL